MELVRFLGRHRFATAEQVQARFGMHRTKAYDRLRGLVHVGCLWFDEGVRSRRVHGATGAGLVSVDLDLPVARASPAMFAHDLAMVDAAIPLERDGALRVLTERQIRRLDQLPGTRDRYSLRVVGQIINGQAWPDLVVVGPGNDDLTAIEVELTQKKSGRIRSKVRAYVTSQYQCVLYITDSASIAKTVRREAHSYGLEQKITVKSLAAGAAALVEPHDELMNEVTSLRQTIRRLERERDEQYHRATQAEETNRNAQLMIERYVDSGRARRAEILANWKSVLGR